MRTYGADLSSWSLVSKLVDQGNCSYNNDQMVCRVSSVSSWRELYKCPDE